MVQAADRIEGLRETRKALRDFDAKLPRELRIKGNEAAAIIVEEGKRRASTPQQRKAAESLRALSTQGSVRVALGKKSHPFALGAEFGSVQFKQFPPWRGNDENAGYFLWPAIRAKRAEVLSKFLDGIDDVTRQAGLK